MEFLRKYGVATTLLVPVIKAGSTDFAVSADWTPVAGDVKVIKNEDVPANITTLPTVVGNMWKFSLSVAEVQAARVVIQIVDSAVKAVEDQAIVIITHGNASANITTDLNGLALEATLTPKASQASVTALDNVADGIQADLNNGLDGLGALKTAIDSKASQTSVDTIDLVVDGIQSDLSNATDGLGALAANQLTMSTNILTIDAVVDGIQADLSNGVDGLGALKALVDALPTVAAIADGVWDEAQIGHVTAGSFGEMAIGILTVISNLSTVDIVVDGIQTDLSNATDGLGALKTAIDSKASQASVTALDNVADGIQADLSNTTDGLGALRALILVLDTVADGIKTKTDQLTFTLANKLDSNAQAINDSLLTGDGKVTPIDAL